MKNIFRVGFVAVLAAGPVLSAVPVDFDRDIRPLLSDACFHCHGPDGKNRKAKLRLDTKEGATALHDDGAAIVPGDPARSQAMTRMLSKDPDERMPPPDAPQQLKPEQIELLRRWIADGAKWAEHWAFVPPVRPAVPVDARGWSRNPIDNFVVATLAKQNLVPAPAAPVAVLARRLALDLTGLPPTPAQVAAAGGSPQAVDLLVEELLKSPAYGERMAWPWLDAARYADSNGYQGDNERTAWPWRDWVIDAFNRNMRFDDFTVCQIAGDLLPDATAEQRLATGFLRNHAINGEGGRIPEENRVDYIFDQLETVGANWLALTFNCCRCHDHKYDPLLQKDYYAMFDFFNRTKVNGGGGDPQSAPNLEVPTADQSRELGALGGQIAGLRAKLADRAKAVAAEAGSSAAAGTQLSTWEVLKPTEAIAISQQLKIESDGKVLAGGENPNTDEYTVTMPLSARPLATIRLDALRHKTMTKGGLGRSDSGNFVLTEVAFILLRGDQEMPLRIAGARASATQTGYPIEGTYDGNPSTGWAVWQGKPISEDVWGVFTLAEAATPQAGDRLRAVLRHQSKHVHHNIGYFRLSGLDRPADPADDSPRDPAEAALAQDAVHTQLKAELAKSEARQGAIRKEMPKVMIMADTEKRKSYILDHGLYTEHRGEVTAAVPHFLPSLPTAVPADRLALARWLVAPENPLTARVIMNRLWAQFMGVGLVKTTENFGSQGERPVNPELLDWLAVEFMASGWDMQHMVRLIVGSNAYRQQGTVTAAALEADPENRFVSRGPRFRMPSWMIRDQALAVSGLLVPAIGGTPVFPYQPDGVWAEMTFGKKRYKADNGDGLHRRSIYTFWRRIAAPTMFFDAAQRQACEVREIRTNTPLHALATLNDTTYVEAARVLAGQLLQEPGSDSQRIARLVDRTLHRQPTAAEIRVLQAGLDRQRQLFAADADAANKLAAVGETRVGGDPAALAAWSVTCLTVLNLDETLTKE